LSCLFNSSKRAEKTLPADQEVAWVAPDAFSSPLSSSIAPTNQFAERVPAAFRQNLKNLSADAQMRKSFPSRMHLLPRQRRLLL